VASSRSPQKARSSYRTQYRQLSMPFCDGIVSRREFFRINFLWELIRLELKLRGTSVFARQNNLFKKPAHPRHKTDM
jgi:hypothetical protein